MIANINDIVTMASAVKFSSECIVRNPTGPPTISKMFVIEWDGELFGLDQFIVADSTTYESMILVKNIDSERTPAFKNLIETIVAKIPDGDWKPTDHDGMTASQKIEKYFGCIDGNWEFNIYSSGTNDTDMIDTYEEATTITIPDNFKILFPFTVAMDNNVGGATVEFV